jgi:hypothetical protein
MAFILNNLTAMRPFGGKMLYGYVTNDTKATIQGAGYFNNASTYFSVGDVINVSGDLDGTPFHTSYVVSAISAGVVTLTEHAAVTQNVKQVITARVPVLGTASTHYVVCPIAGSVTKVLGVSNGNGATATGTITVTVPTTGAIATLPFVSGYTAGAAVEDTTITAHTALLAGGVITVATDGGGDGAGEVIVTLEITPS